jgi:acyl-Coa thioesterase superfamily protein
MLFFLDAIPPATMRIGSSGWVPTLQMSTYLRARPAPGRLGIRMTAHVVHGGMVDETCTLWDSTGAVVAQGTQLARLRFADETG